MKIKVGYKYLDFKIKKPELNKCHDLAVRDILTKQKIYNRI